MELQNLKWEVRDEVGWLTVNRPDALNALDAVTLQELRTLLEQVNRDEAIRALVVTGAGDKAFVAGADIRAMARMGPEEGRSFAELGQRTLDRLEALPIPTLAAVNGYALGGGCELALACDLIYASETAQFGLPEVSLGLVPGFGGTQRLQRRVGSMRALELIFTGDRVSAARAREIGLALEVLPPGELAAYVQGQARKMATKGALAIAQAKQVIRSGADAGLSSALERELQAFSVLFGTEDAAEGLRAFVEKRPPRFRGR